MLEPESTLPTTPEIQHITTLVKAERTYKTLQPGEIIGKRYQILKELGSGGFGMTYLATDLDSSNYFRCVVKQLQPRFNSPLVWQNAKQRFATEALVLQKLGNHPQIPSLLGYFEEDREFYLIQEFIEGEELRQEVSNQLFNEVETIAFLYDALEILEFVHQQGVIHRDIKPSNLLRRRKDGKIVLIDFGAVKEINTLSIMNNGESVRTQIIGTPGYMPPEQHVGKPIYSSDIYALGKTAIFALTGLSPIELEDSETNSLTDWQKYTNISTQLFNIVERMISSKTIERYNSASEVIRDLEPLLRIGKTIGKKYRITHYLGKNKFSHTYQIENLWKDSRLNCAVKIFSLSDVSSKEKELLSYRQQLEKLSENTPIAKIIDCFIENRELFLVREYIRGSSYDCQIKENKSLNTEVIINFLEQVLQILDSLHQKGFIHGNLKPANTIFSEEGKCILTDLGIGSAINFPCAHRNWPLGNDYIPIEQKSTPLSVLDDLYAIGIMGTQALTGMNSYDIPLAVQTSGIVPRSRDIAERNLSKILEKLLKKRYRDAQEVLKDLRKVKRQSILMVLQPWNKYILATILGGLSFVFINYLWLQYQAIVLFERGDIRLESKDYPEALKSYNQGISKVKGKVGFFERAWIGKAMALSNLKQYSEMKEVCQEVIRAKQESPYGWNCLGLAFFGLEQYNEAMEAYNKALKDNPEFLEALNNRGYAYQKLNRYNDAIADFQKAIELDAQHTISYVTYNNLGNLYYQQKEYQLALKAYQTSIEINNNYLSSWLGLGNVQRQIQQDKEAKYSYTKAVKIDRKSYEAWYLKGLVEEKLAEYTEALESYKAAIEIKEDYQSAIEAKNRLLSKYPKN